MYDSCGRTTTPISVAIINVDFSQIGERQHGLMRLVSLHKPYGAL